MDPRRCGSMARNCMSAAAWARASSRRTATTPNRS
jgi:hypothetical protein